MLDDVIQKNGVIMHSCVHKVIEVINLINLSSLVIYLLPYLSRLSEHLVNNWSWTKPAMLK